MDETDQLVAGLVDLDDHSDDYRRAMAYYDGKVGEMFASRRVQLETGGTSDYYAVNIAKTPVDAVTDRLTIQSITAVNPAGEIDKKADDALQNQVIGPNGLGKQLPRLIRNVGIYGDAYLYLWSNQDATDRPIILAYNSPLSVRMIYSPEDDSVPLYAVKRWIGDGVEYANLITGIEVVRYHLDPSRSEKKNKWRDPGAWVEVAREEHDLGRNPVEHFASWLPYGRPEHGDAYGAQNAIGKLSPTMVDSAELSGYPSRYIITGADSSLRGDRPDRLDFDDDADQDLTTEQRHSRLRAGPGEIALLENVVGAGQWSAATSSTFIDAANWFFRAAAQTTTTPLHMLDPGGATPSGESRRIADAPLEVKVALRRASYGEGLEAVLTAAVRALGYDDVSVRVRWAPSPVADDTMTWQVASAKIAVGVPPEIAIVETGLYDADVVHGWFTAQDEAMGVARRIGLLGEFAGAVAQLSQGVSLGLLDEAQARSIITHTVGQLMPDTGQV